MKTFLHIALVGFITTTLRAAPPNVLLIVVNSQNCELGCYGSTTVKTPNLDKLAARGVRFTRAYCQNTSQGASKLSMLTGLTPRTLGVMTHYRYAPELPKNSFTLPRWLKDNGFFTAKAGRVFQGEDYPLSGNSLSLRPPKRMSGRSRPPTWWECPCGRKARIPRPTGSARC